MAAPARSGDGVGGVEDTDVNGVENAEGEGVEDTGGNCVCWERRSMNPGLNPSGRLVGPVIRTCTRHFWRIPQEPEEHSY